LKKRKFKFTISDLSGSVRVSQGLLPLNALLIISGVQLPQSGYLSLQTPYVMFGLGFTSNYIEQIFMGVSVKDEVIYFFKLKMFFKKKKKIKLKMLFSYYFIECLD
jgi:hypothetical protein